jgi:hypothetical protein
MYAWPKQAVKQPRRASRIRSSKRPVEATREEAGAPRARSHRQRAHAVAEPRRRVPRLRGLRGHGRARHGRHRLRARGALRPLQRRHPPPRGPRRHRRNEWRDRRLGAASRRRARRLPRRDRHARGARAALEEGGLRGRRGVDRARFVGEGRGRCARPRRAFVLYRAVAQSMNRCGCRAFEITCSPLSFGRMRARWKPLASSTRSTIHLPSGENEPANACGDPCL